MGTPVIVAVRRDTEYIANQTSKPRIRLLLVVRQNLISNSRI